MKSDFTPLLFAINDGALTLNSHPRHVLAVATTQQANLKRQGV
jgi:hypothetical protein